MENISTHTPHAGRDGVTDRLEEVKRFQLTRPMRGVTAMHPIGATSE